MTRHPWVKEAFRAQPEPFLGQLCPEEGVWSLPHVFRLLGPKYMRFRALESKTYSLGLGEVKCMLSLKFPRVTFHQFKRRVPPPPPGLARWARWAGRALSRGAEDGRAGLLAWVGEGAQCCLALFKLSVDRVNGHLSSEL